MPYSGNLIYVNGQLLPPNHELRVEDDIDTRHGSYEGLLSGPPGPTLPNKTTIEVHHYKLGLLICRLRAGGDWRAADDEYEQRRYPVRLLLRLTECG